MCEIKVGDKVFCIGVYDSGVGTVLKVVDGMVSTKWCNSERFPRTCNDYYTVIMALDKSHVFKLGNAEIYIDGEITAEKIIEEFEKFPLRSYRAEGERG